MLLKGKKKNVAGIRFRQTSSAPTTEPIQLGEPRRLRCLIAAVGGNQCLQRKKR